MYVVAFTSRIYEKAKLTSDGQALRSADDPYKRPLYPLEVRDDWRQLLHKICKQTSNTPTVLICGQKSVGKSTLSRLFINRLLTQPSSSPPTQTRGSVFLLDLDPGQPEFTVPGQLSLVNIQEPIFGPPFTQASPGASNYVVRAHSIAATTPAENTEHYLACALDLAGHALRRASSEGPRPIVINCPGWYMGVGIDIVKELIRSIPSVTDVIALTPSMGRIEEKVTATAKEAKVRLHFLAPQADSGSESRTAAEFREMQMISYFHHQQGESGPLLLPEPISARRPYEVSYAEGSSGFVGIMDYTEFPSMKFVGTLLNGSIVAIVEVEDEGELAGREVTRENDMQIPFIKPGPDGWTAPLSPGRSRFLGLGLIRSIAVQHQALHLLTPLPADAVSALDAARLVLVRGSFDTPAWAFKEEVYWQEAGEQRIRRPGVSGGGELEFGDASERGNYGQARPWVRRVAGSEGGGLVGASWRTRRFQ